MAFNAKYGDYAIRDRLAKEWHTTPFYVLDRETHEVLTHLSYMSARIAVEEANEQMKSFNK